MRARLTDFTAPGLADQFPDLDTHFASLNVWALYRYRHNLAIKLGYRYEDYDADNWAYDGVTETSVNKIQLLGESTQDYSKQRDCGVSGVPVRLSAILSCAPA